MTKKMTNFYRKCKSKCYTLKLKIIHILASFEINLARLQIQQLRIPKFIDICAQQLRIFRISV